ncbi:MAG: methyltransferase domain-containing protein [Thermodesulfobacteriota bacterium]|nr:methyltransferase domain-containing protein [Thermodesulfobacteriota bacterium]
MDSPHLPEKTKKILKRIRKRFTVDFEPLRVGNIELNILKVTDLEQLLGGKDPFENVSEFPFWIKLWESSMVLAELMASLPPAPEKSLLELGAGLAAPGLVAAANGSQVTLSDYEPHILDFERVSAAASNISNVNFKIVDWNNPPNIGKFDTIIGAEILFRDDFFQPLLNIFNQYLETDGIIYLAHDVRRKSLPKFLRLAEKEFVIGTKTRKIRSEIEELTVMINRLTKK